jgi:hypothetical protein
MCSTLYIYLHILSEMELKYEKMQLLLYVKAGRNAASQLTLPL